MNSSAILRYNKEKEVWEMFYVGIVRRLSRERAARG